MAHSPRVGPSVPRRLPREVYINLLRSAPDPFALYGKLAKLLTGAEMFAIRVRMLRVAEEIAKRINREGEAQVLIGAGLQATTKPARRAGG